ncbi:hypothetical protein [Streptomyces sp. NPDC059881]|uniref:hypothetical protein n=1 Tax=Streptomyces sp. NPDC059881 TaxID=3346986 RepID=UPI003651E0A1
MEPDILAPPQRVATRIARWEESLDALLPAMVDGANLLVATWSLRAFGGLIKAWSMPEGVLPMRNFTDVHLVAVVGRRFDVVVV